MDSSLLQARLFPGLAIKIQRSNGEGRGPEAKGTRGLRRQRLPPLPKQQALNHYWGFPSTPQV